MTTCPGHRRAPGRPGHPLGRFPARARVLGACLSLAGCSGPPAINVVGSYFPAWMLSAIAGIALAVVLRQLLVLTGIEDRMILPLVTHAAVALAATLGIWLLWFGH